MTELRVWLFLVVLLVVPAVAIAATRPHHNVLLLAPLALGAYALKTAFARRSGS